VVDQFSFFQQIIDGLQRAILPGAATLREQLVFWFGLFLWLEVLHLCWAVLCNGRRISGIAGILLKGTILWFLLYHFPELFEGVVAMFTRIGLTVGQQRISIAQFLDPGQYLRLAYQAAQPLHAVMTAHFGLTSLGTGVGYLLLWLAFIASFAVMAGHVFVWQIEMLVAGVMLLALIPTLTFRATQWIGQAMFAFVMNLALKLGLGALLVSLTFPLMDKLSLTAGEQVSFQRVTVMVIGGWVVAVLFFAVNRMASGLASGIPQLTGGLLVSAAAGSAAVVGAVASGGASLGLGAAAGSAGVGRLGLGAAGTVRGVLTRSAGTPMLAAARTGRQQALASTLAQRLRTVGTGSTTMAAGQGQRSLRHFADASRYVGHDQGGHGFRH
jgi:type IV secretion system protein TrbL